MEFEFDLLDYVKAVDQASTRQELVAATELLEEIGVEAKAQAKALSEEDFLYFREHLSEERAGRGMGQYEKFGDILLPPRTIPLYSLCEHFGAPLGVAYNQMQRAGIDFASLLKKGKASDAHSQEL